MREIRDEYMATTRRNMRPQAVKLLPNLLGYLQREPRVLLTATANWKPVWVEGEKIEQMKAAGTWKKDQLRVDEQGNELPQSKKRKLDQPFVDTDEEEEPNIFKRVNKRERLSKLLVELIKKYWVKNKNQLMSLAKGPQLSILDKEELWKAFNMHSFNAMYEMAQSWVRNDYVMASFTEILAISRVRTWPDVYDITTSQKIMQQLVDHNQIDVGHFLNCTFDIFNKTFPKKNALVFEGGVSAGKTYIVEAMCRVFPYVGEVQLCGNDQFAFNDAICRNVIKIEEPAITPVYAETMKKLLEGMEMEVPIKHSNAQTLSRTPVVFTTNSPIWHMCPGQKEAFLARSFIFHMYPAPFLKNYTKRLNPLIFMNAWEAMAKNELKKAEPCLVGPGYVYPPNVSRKEFAMRHFKIQSSMPVPNFDPELEPSKTNHVHWSEISENQEGMPDYEKHMRELEEGAAAKVSREGDTDDDDDAILASVDLTCYETVETPKRAKRPDTLPIKESHAQDKKKLRMHRAYQRTQKQKAKGVLFTDDNVTV